MSRRRKPKPNPDIDVMKEGLAIIIKDTKTKVSERLRAIEVLGKVVLIEKKLNIGESDDANFFERNG